MVLDTIHPHRPRIYSACEACQVGLRLGHYASGPLEFSIGQSVASDHELTARYGIIGALVNDPYNRAGGGRVDVLWHQSGITTSYFCDRLVLYVNPMDAQGRSAGAHWTWAALDIVLDQERPHAMGEMQRDLERARMTAQDLRKATISPYRNSVHTRDPRRRPLTWREFAKD